MTHAKGYHYTMSKFKPTAKQKVIRRLSDISRALIINYLNRAGVERNPGPVKLQKIMTHNVRGLSSSVKKIKSVFSLYKSIIGKENCILGLQEIHEVSIRMLKNVWSGKMIVNNGTRNSCGVAIVVSDNWEIKESITDNEGRMVIVHLYDCVLRKNMIVTNIYAPNDHKKALNFFEKTFEQMIALKEKLVLDNIEDCTEVIMGDFNYVVEKEDRSTENLSQAEKDLSIQVNKYMEDLELKDCIAFDQDSNKFTWQGKRNRQLSQSRIDRIFCSTNLLNTCKRMTKKWGIGKSDHALLSSEFGMEIKSRGKGLVRLKGDILKDKIYAKKIEKELNIWLNSMNNEWDPHTKWEFAKTALRSIVLPIMNKPGREKEKEKIELIEKITSEKNSITLQNTSTEIEAKENRCRELEEKLDAIMSREIEDLAIKSGIKWREEGEKSTKYFLGLIKKRRDETYIDGLRDESNILKHRKEDMMNIAHTYYKNLYSKKETNSKSEEEANFLDQKIKITKEDSTMLDHKINLDELRSTLKTTKDSAPGEDGIPYSYYKTFLDTLGPLLLESWEHSLVTGKLSPSQTRSCISLLPKKDKDGQKIENWRPISLSNCDIKLITKTIALRLNKVLPGIIHKSQAAYVKGRIISNNIRLIQYFKKESERHKENSMIISLDVKKAYDSLSHNYLLNVLKKYGFSEAFIKIVQTLYDNNEARIMINGYSTDAFKIERGVKQGDALSCGLFIIAMDPLIRTLSTDKGIKSPKFWSQYNVKCTAYADDITILCDNSKNSIRKVFAIYEKFTEISGLELNASKTEILNVGNNAGAMEYSVKYMDEMTTIRSVEELKIGGISFARKTEIEHQRNVQERIDMMESQLRRWMCRDLTINGRSIVAKTFGVSQIIYSMQACEFKEQDLKRIEQLYFKFLWAKKWNVKHVERIKRACLKQEKQHGGINALDIQSLYTSIKVKQVIRALDSELLKQIQSNLLKEGNSGFKGDINFDFKNINNWDSSTGTFQKTINDILDQYRIEGYGTRGEEINTRQLFMGLNMDVEAYARRLGLNWIVQQLRKINYNRMSNLNLLQLKNIIHREDDVRYEDKDYERLVAIWTHIPIALRDLTEILTAKPELGDFVVVDKTKTVKLSEINTKSLQIFFKKLYGKTTNIDFRKKHGINIDQNELYGSIAQTYKLLKNPSLRALRLRLWHNDIFCGVKLKIFNMEETDKCKRCNKTENTEHQIYDCKEAKKMWEVFNRIMRSCKLSECMLNNYKDVLLTRKCDVQQSEVLKMVIIKENIQINRTIFNIKRLLDKMDFYINIEIRTKNSDVKRWLELKRAVAKERQATNK
jgi:exonuclease III